MNIRPAKKDDMMFLLDLRNDDLVRKMAFNSEKIDIKTHEQWFYSKLNSDNSVILIAETEQQKIGQVRFDFNDDASAEITIAITPEHRGKGYGTKLIQQSCKYIFDNYAINKIIAHIKSDNKASIKAFEKTGFKEKKEIFFKNATAIELILFK